MKREMEGKAENTSKPKLPKTVYESLPKEIADNIEANAEDPTTIKYFTHARRFNNPRGRDRDGEEEDDEPEFVELLWDQDGKGQLKVVKGNAAYETELVNVENVAEEVERRVKALLENGYKEFENFIEAHKKHIPCFLWTLADTPPAADAPITSSRVGGSPAMIKGEDIDLECMTFAFQIDLSTIPRRMQEIVGKSGLLQLFFNQEEWYEEEHLFRIIPEDRFGELEATETPESRDDFPEVKPRAILGWQERADYTESDLKLYVDKFGGFGIYIQGGGDDEERPCSCGEAHMHRRETFHMEDDSPLGFGLGDAGTANFCYCPNQERPNTPPFALSYEFEASCC